MSYTVGGKIILEDQFSGVLAKLGSGAKGAELLLEQMGKALDNAPAVLKIKAIEHELDQLRAKSKAGTATILDVEAFARLNNEASSLRSTMAQMSGMAGPAKLFGMSAEVGSLSEKLGRLTMAFGAVGVAIGAVAGTAAAGIRITEFGTQVERTAVAFTLLAGGSNQAAAKLAAVAAASGGAMDHMAAMNVATKAGILGLANTAQELERVVKFATIAGRVLGTDTATAIDNLAMAAANLSWERLDQMGVASSQVKARFQELRGELGDQKAFLMAVLETGEKTFGGLEGSAIAGASGVEMITAKIRDLRAEAAQGISLVIEPIAKGAAMGMGLGSYDQYTEQARAAIKAAMEEPIPLQIEFGPNLPVSPELADSTQNVTEDVSARYVAMQKQIILALEGVKQAESRGIRGASAYADSIKAIASESVGAAGSLQAIMGIEERVNEVQGWLLDTLILIPPEIQAQTAAQAKLNSVREQYNKLMMASETEASKGGPMQQMAAIMGQVEALRKGLAAAPKLDMSSILMVDTTALREWVASAIQADDSLRAVQGDALNTVGEVEKLQSTMIATAMGTGSTAEALDRLARSTLGAGASAVDLVAKFGSLPAALQAVILQANGLSVAMDRIMQQAARPVTVDVKMRGFESALNSVGALSTRLARVTNLDTARRAYDRYTRVVRDAYQNMGNVTAWEMDAMVNEQLSGLEKIVTGQEDADRRRTQSATKAMNAIRMSASQFTSAVEAAMKSGLEVTSADMLATKAGTYKDKALESARQLQAIAERGSAELQVHPDWAGMLKIPPEVLAQGEDALKAWAAQTQQAVVDLTRPDLINWDAFIENFKAGQQADVAKQMTIDLALEKLTAAGVSFEGSTEDQKKKIAEQLGIAMPTMNVETYFQAADGASGALVQDLTAGTGYLDVPVRPVWSDVGAGAAAAASGITGSAIPAGQQGLGVAGAGAWLNMNTSQQAPMAQSGGSQLAGSMIAGFQTTVGGTDIAAIMVGSWGQNFKDHSKDFETMGTNVGNIMAAALIAAIAANAGLARRRIAEMIAPEVAAIMKSQGSGRTELP